MNLRPADRVPNARAPTTRSECRSTGDNVRLAKAIGTNLPRYICCSLAPRSSLEASVVTKVGDRGSKNSNHKPLQSLLQHSSLRERDKFIRWAEQISRFDFDFEFVVGVSSCLADCLSRLPSPTVTWHDDIPSRPVVIAKVTDGINMFTILQAAVLTSQYAALLRAILKKIHGQVWMRLPWTPKWSEEFAMR